MKKVFLALCLSVFLASCSTRTELTILSFNLRYDNPDDGFNSWPFRKDISAQLIREQDADIIGMQEVLHHQLKSLEFLLPGYTSIGVGREDGKERGEYCPLLFRKDKFNVLESGYFWLSETPEIAGSKGWDAACERVATWAVLSDIKSGKSIFIMNTHLDHQGVTARREGAALLSDRVKNLSDGLPVVITGDFNASPDSDVIRQILETPIPETLYHSKDVAKKTGGTDWTYHGFGNVAEKDREFIDYIFACDKIKVSSHDVLPEKMNDQYISDHSVIAVKINY